MADRTSRRFYYGWVIVAVCGVTLLVTFGIRLSFTVFFVSLTEAFGWTRASTSLVFSVTMIVFALASIPTGMAMDRWGARIVFVIGAAVLAAGLILSSRINTLTELILAYGVVAGLGITILGLAQQAALLAAWFRRRLGLAIGLAFAGTGLGSMILTPSVQFVIANDDWRAAYRFLALLALCLIPLLALFVRRSPQSMGLRLVDYDAPRNGERHLQTVDFSWTAGRAMRTRAFWLVIIAALGAIGPLRMLTVHQLAVAAGAGVDRLYAASVIGLAGGISAAAFIFFGYISDRIGRRRAYLIGSLFLISAIIILASLRAPEQRQWLLFYALMLGLGEGSRSSLVTAVASDLFPGPALGTINSAVGAAFGAGAAFFPWLAGRIFDLRGAYTVAFLAGIVVIAVSTAALWLAAGSRHEPAAGT